MRFVLRQGSREVIFFSENRFMRFEGADTASNFLLDYLIQADNLGRLREALRSHQAWSWLAMRDDATVLDYTSKLLAEGMLHLLADTEAMLPWTWQFRSPTFPVEALQSDFVSEALVALEDEMEELEAEVEDILPDPVLPPTFIQVADMEAKGITFLEKMYEMAMDLLRFVGLEGELPSELAPEFTETAKGNGVAINELTESFTAQLDPLVVGGMDKVPTTQAGEQMLQLAFSEGIGVKEITENTADALGDLMGKGDLPPPTEVGPVLLNEGEKQGAQLLAKIEEIAQPLELLADPTMPDIRPTELGPKLAEVAEFNAEAMEQSHAIIRANLALMAALGAFEEPPPAVPLEMVNIASSQIVGVMNATQATIETFGALAEVVPLSEEDVSAICQQFQATTMAQVESLTNSTDFVGAEVRGLLNITPPELHDPSPVGDAFISSAHDQIAGMLRAALAAGESLVGIVTPPSPPI